LLVDAHGTPLALTVEDARTHDVKLVDALLSSLSVPHSPHTPPPFPKELLADKGFAARSLRDTLADLGIVTHIPDYPRGRKPKVPAPPPTFPPMPPHYRHRWQVERCFAWMDNCRRLVVRYERSASLYRSFCLLALSLWAINRFLK
jgi:transposase